MKTDIEIAQEAVMEPIGKVAEKIGIGEDDLELYGKYKAKLSNELIKRVEEQSGRQTCTDDSNQSDTGRRG